MTSSEGVHAADLEHMYSLKYLKGDIQRLGQLQKSENKIPLI